MRGNFIHIWAVFLLFGLPTLISALPANADDPILLNDYALELINRGDHEKALEQLQKAYTLFSSNENLRKNLAAAYALVGERQMAHNRFDEAAASFDAARELLPDNKRYGVLRGIAFYSGKRYDAAESEFVRARQSGVKTVELLYYLGRLYYDTDNLAGALDAWEQALALDPGNRGVREQLEKARREEPVESRMDKGYSSRFNLAYDTNVTSHLAGEILNVLETAYNKVGRDLNHFPASRIPVIIYASKDYRTLTAGPDWSGGLYDGKIRIPIGGAVEITPLLKSALIHEYTHVVVFELTNGHCPTWLNEGVAEVEGRMAYNPPMAELGKRAKHGGFHSLKTLEGPFAALATRDAALAYQQSYSMVNFMVSTYGWHKVREILVNLGAGMPPDDAISKALSGVGLNYEGFAEEWRTYMRKEFGN
jgi:tetratricopeptide (TPR) repeat protein